MLLLPKILKRKNEGVECEGFKDHKKIKTSLRKRIDRPVGEARYADRNILKRRLVVCVSLSNIVGYCIQHENYRIRCFRQLAPFLGRLENRIFFPACANCLVAVVDSTTFLHCKWVKVGVHEALTEKTIL